MTGDIITGEGRHPLSRVSTAALRTAGALRSHGVRPGDRVLLATENSVEQVVALLALMHLDASIVLVDRRRTAPQQAAIEDRTRAGWLLHDADDALRTTSSTAPAPLSVEDLCGVYLRDGAPADDLADGLQLEDWRGRRDAVVCWSSGTTGEPKAIARTGNSVLRNIESTAHRMEYRADDVLLPLLPFSHQYGLSLVLLWWTTGCSLVIPPHSRLDHAVRFAVDAGVTVVDAAPSTYHSLLKLTARRPVLGAGLESVRMFCVGGAPLGERLAGEFRERMGRPLLDGYGSSEAGNIALATLADPVGCGQPLDGVDLRIHAEDGTQAAPGAAGEISVRTPGLMSGYLDAEGALAPLVDDRYRTGDLGYRDAQGNVHVIGRKRAVHRLGHTLYPEALAAAAEACGRPVRVVPVDDERLGCRLVFVVEDEAGQDAGHWRRAMAPHLPSHGQPNVVLVVPELPLNRNGKTDAHRLRQLAEGAVGRAEGQHPAPGAAAQQDHEARQRVQGRQDAEDREHRDGREHTQGREQPAGTPIRTIAGATPMNRNPSSRTAPIPGRLDALDAVRGHVAKDPAPLLKILTEIANHQAAESDVASFLATLGGAAREIETYRPGRVGRTAVFMPSNVLLYSYALFVLVPSLYSEDVVFRPSSQVADQTRRLHEYLAPVHGLPVTLSDLGQRAFVEGPVSEADVLVFTGTYTNGEKVREQLRRDQLLAFFGQGINPFIVAPGADPLKAAQGAVSIRMYNSGQDCYGPDVFFVHADELEGFLASLNAQLDALRFGEHTDPAAGYGPIYYEAAMEMAADHLRRHAKWIVRGGEVDFRRRRIAPTVLVRPMSDKGSLPEMFAPIFNVIPYDDTEQLHRRLSSPFFNERAMGAMVYGDAPDTVELLSQRHHTSVNRTLLDEEDGNGPFGGRGVIANYLAYGKTRIAEPLLLSKVVAEHFPAVLALRAAQESR
ncbi:aldehyde dehydrogenase family protein [Streptomyces sp. NPDC051907]|uniref:aldehyde dehydrogenase family protein n=1 Tax=Streptomyces sp. NPDC051907 TaxID=3155284 RepID=UPI00343454EA